MANNREASGADLVQGVLWRVPVRYIMFPVQIDDIGGRDIAFQEWIVIVINRSGFIHEYVCVTEIPRRSPDKIDEPFRGAAFPLEVRRARANDVGQQESSYL